MNPITDNPGESVAAIGERALIGRIREWLGAAAPASPRGMGDDCALTDGGTNLLTCDSVVRGRHFDDECRPELAGAKLLKRNVSDIAAMGGIPREALLALMLPRQTSLAWLEGFVRGLAAAALDYSVLVVGGDVTEAPAFCASLSLTGRASRPLLRGTGSEGDLIYVGGPLGGSIRGHHLTFQPRVEQGMFLSYFEGVSACMDLSDGLAKDAPDLAGPGLCAALELDAIPPSIEAQEMCDGDGAALLRSVLCDGEDYELLFSVRADRADELEAAWFDRFGGPCFRIGTLVPHQPGGPGLVDAATGLPPEGCYGYEHLR